MYAMITNLQLQIKNNTDSLKNHNKALKRLNDLLVDANKIVERRIK